MNFPRKPVTCLGIGMPLLQGQKETQSKLESAGLYPDYSKSRYRKIVNETGDHFKMKLPV